MLNLKCYAGTTDGLFYAGAKNNTAFNAFSCFHCWWMCGNCVQLNVTHPAGGWISDYSTLNSSQKPARRHDGSCIDFITSFKEMVAHRSYNNKGATVSWMQSSLHSSVGLQGGGEWMILAHCGMCWHFHASNGYYKKIWYIMLVAFSKCKPNCWGKKWWF